MGLRLSSFIAVLTIALLAACSGGGSVSSPRPQPSSSNGQGVSPTLDQKVNFSVIVPAAPVTTSSKTRRTADDTVYVSPNTQSISIRVVSVNGVSLQSPPNAQTSDVPTSCQGTTGCTVSVTSVPAAVGVDQFLVTTYAGPAATGLIVSTGLIAVSITGSGTVDATVGGGTTLALGGYVQSLGITIVPPTLFFSEKQTAAVTITPKDAAGATIVGNVLFGTPITVSVSGLGLSLSGPGLQGNGTVLLTQPQSSAITLADDGSASSGSVSASTLNSANATVATTVPLAFVTPTPSPTPPPTPTPTPLPSGVTPSPSPTPTAVPSSVYVLNAYDNTIVEYSAPAITGSTQTITTPPRRIVGGTEGCPITGNAVLFPFGVLSVTTDAAGDVWAATDGQECTPPIEQTMYAYAPSAGPTSPPGQTSAIPPVGGDVTSNFLLQIAYNPSSSLMADPPLEFGSPYDVVSEYKLSGGAPQLSLGRNGCIWSPGLPNSAPNKCSDPNGGFFSGGVDPNGGTPIAVDASGNLYVLVLDNASGNTAIVRISTKNQVGGSAAVQADTNFIEGANVPFSGPVSMAVDDASQTLWVLDFYNALGGNANVALYSFPLSVFGGTACLPGPGCNAAPAAYLTASTYATNGSPFAGPESSLGAGHGLVYLAAIYGSTCDPTYCANSILGPPPEGEVDVYNAAITGTHINDPMSAPVAIIKGPFVRSPIAVAFGPHGTFVGTSGSRPTIRPQRLTWSQVAALRHRANVLRSLRGMAPRQRRAVLLELHRSGRL